MATSVQPSHVVTTTPRTLPLTPLQRQLHADGFRSGSVAPMKLLRIAVSLACEDCCADDLYLAPYWNPGRCQVLCRCQACGAEQLVRDESEVA